MSNPIIIECANQDSRMKNTTGLSSDFTVDIGTPVNIDDGDVVQINKVFIDASDGEINIKESINLTALIGFYDINYLANVKTFRNGAAVDYQPYIAYKQNVDSSGDLESFDIIPKPNVGNYDWQSLWVQVDYKSKGETDDNDWQSENFSISASGGNRHKLTVLTDTRYATSQMANPIEIFYGLYNFKIFSNDPDHDPGNPQDYFMIDPASLVYNNIQQDTQVYTRNLSYTLPAGSYSRDLLAKTITDLFVEINLDGAVNPNNINPWLIRTDDPSFAGNSLIWTKCGFDPSVGNPEQYVYEEADTTPQRIWCGTSQPSLIFDDNANVFNLSFHTPMAGGGGPRTPGASIFRLPNVANGDMFSVPVATGTFFLDIQPASFWNGVLNFDLTKIKVNYDVVINPNKNAISKAELLSKTTRALVSCQSIFPDYNRNYAGQGFPINLDISETIPIVSGNVYGLSTLFYLIEVNIGSETFIYDNKGLNSFMRAIVSNYNNENNLITGYSTDSMPYIHRGSSQLLKTIRIRILDPTTKLPIPDLGPNNFVYIQIIKNLQNL